MAAKHVKASQLTGVTPGYHDLLRISGASGELKSIGVSDGIAYHRFRVEIDGCEVVDAPLAATASGGPRANTGLTMGLRFEQSLLVQVSASVLSPQTTYWAVACTDSSEPISRNTFVQFIDGVPYRFEERSYLGEDGSVYEVSAEIGPDQISEIVIDDEFRPIGGPIRGRVKLHSAVGEPLYAERVPLVMRPTGSLRNRPILDERDRTFTLERVEGDAGFELPANLLDQLNAPVNRYLVDRGYPPIFYLGASNAYVEIAADLNGYSNIPASVELW